MTASATVGPPAASAGGFARAPTPTEKPHRLVWSENWHRFRTVEYATTAATGVAAIAVFLFAHSSTRSKWTGPIFFDAPVRDALRMRTRGGLQAADEASGYAALVTPAQALFDSLVLPLADGNLELIWQLGMMDAESYALSGLLTAGLYDLTGRARPSSSNCIANPNSDPLCGYGTNASFPSGHAAAAMTGAGLICAHHGSLPLYGGGVWDVAACVESLAVATSVGVLRLMGDRHYASDVLTGSALGFVSGYVLPTLLHYRTRPLGEIVGRRDLKVGVVPGSGAGQPVGLQVVGLF